MTWKEVELDNGLRDEEVPQEAWGVRGHTFQHSEKVRFEGADNPLRRIASVHIVRDDLKLGPPSLSYLPFIGHAGLVVQYRKVDILAALLQRFHNRCICFKAMSIPARFEGARKDHIRVAVACNHNILVATAAANGKSPSVVRVQAADVTHVDMEFAERFFWRFHQHRRGRLCVRWLFGLIGIGGTDTLARLNHVAHNCLIGVGTVLGRVVVG